MRLISILSRFLAVVCLLSVVGVVPAAGQKRNFSADLVGEASSPTLLATSTTLESLVAAPTPVLIPGTGNVTCESLNDSTNPAFSHITEDWEFKIDPPEEGTFRLDGTDGGELAGGMPPNSNMFLETDLSGPLTLQEFTVLWTSTSSITYLVSAVIVKGGNMGTNVYPYPSLSSGDTGPFIVAGGDQAISHLAFCFEPFTAPTAAPATITGRAIDRYGRGIYGAQVRLMSASAGTSNIVITNMFGYYRFGDVPVGELYQLSVAHKRYRFLNRSMEFSLGADLAGMDFVAQ